ncbi:hypothetical protein [Desulfuribacillus alkaliarsenatis]|uniref:Lipoprotein n=1 Tax=Desulfuribacillus alkaliarsenatis TaxID=766136 RepID=A0A1E5G021_9FIRM|nr:hypothetical protein [Desulfuribacillus alkaliarsenatis]OEF96130.1 hypothetical protein BHF68_10385 [Desulfuribacillus alkaliarsenatis]
MVVKKIVYIAILVLIIATLSVSCLFDNEKSAYDTPRDDNLNSKIISEALEDAILSSEFEEVVRFRLKRTLKELDIYAGEYMDYKDDDKYFVYGVVGLTEDDFKRIELLLRENQQGDIEFKGKIFPAEVTLDELESLRENVHLEFINNDGRHGIVYTYSAISISENRVKLGVHELDDRKLEIVHKTFNNHPGLKVVDGEFRNWH